MGRVIAIVNQKGGVGKSTTAVNLGAYLAESGKSVLLLDLDPQGNATSGVGRKRPGQEGTYQALIGEKPLEEVVTATDVSGLEISPASIDLAGAEVELVSAVGREFRLRECLSEKRAGCDFVLIDCPPSLGILTINGLAAADAVLVPIQTEYYALEGLSQLVSTIEMVRRHLNPGLAMEGVLLTMFDSRTNLSQQVADDVRAYFADRVRVFQSVIPRNVRLSEAPSFGQPISQYDGRSKGAEAYRLLAAEVLSA